MEDKILTFKEIAALFPNEWILLALNDRSILAEREGTVLLHGGDYLELCYKASELPKDRLTTIFFTGENLKSNRKWLKVSRLNAAPPTI